MHVCVCVTSMSYNFVEMILAVLVERLDVCVCMYVRYEIDVQTPTSHIFE